MKDEISGDLVLRVLNAMSQGDNEGKFLGDELALVTKILAAKCSDEDQERILAASLAGHYEMEQADMASDSANGGMAEYRRAEIAVRGVLSEDQILACDSAPGIYRKAMHEMGVSKAETKHMPDTALARIFATMSSLHRRTSGPQNFTGAGFSCDHALPASASAESDFHKQFPDAVRVVRS